MSLDTGSGKQYYHYDALGSTVNLTDEAGLTPVSYQLDPWGHIRNQFGTTVNRHVFTGKEHDENTGLIYFGARYYDPDTARFITQDSYLGQQDTPPSLHRYLYAYSNPTVYIDLMGYDSENVVRHQLEREGKSYVIQDSLDLKTPMHQRAFDRWIASKPEDRVGSPVPTSPTDIPVETTERDEKGEVSRDGSGNPVPGIQKYRVDETGKPMREIVESQEFYTDLAADAANGVDLDNKSIPQLDQRYLDTADANKYKYVIGLVPIVGIRASSQKGPKPMITEEDSPSPNRWTPPQKNSPSKQVATASPGGLKDEAGASIGNGVSEVSSGTVRKGTASVGGAERAASTVVEGTGTNSSAGNAEDWAKLSGQLREASKGKGNFGIGSATNEQAEAMGKAWVGDGYKVANDGKTLISNDGLRQYRPPTYKPNIGKTQANFEQRIDGQATKQWQSNAHLGIQD